MTCSPVCVGVRVLSHADWMRLRAQGNSEVARYSERNTTVGRREKNPISEPAIVRNNNDVDRGFREN